MAKIILLVFLLSILSIDIYAQSPLDSLGCVYLEGIFSKVSDPAKATSLFYEALEGLENPPRKNPCRLERLKADVIDIMLPDEWKQYKSLNSVSDKIAFFRHFWYIRDLTPATAANERLVEHYARLAYARDKYSSLDFRGYDDRGRIYLQYGPPDNTVIDFMPSGTKNIESWAYYGLGAPVTFDFVDKGNGYRLARSLEEAIVTRNIPTAYISSMLRLLLRRSSLSPDYLSLFLVVQEYSGAPSDPRIGGFNRARNQINRALDAYRVKIENVQAHLPKVVTDIFHDIDDLPLTAQLARFKGKAQNHDLVMVYGIKASDIKYARDKETLALSLKSAIRDTNRLFVANKLDTLHLNLSKFNDSEKFTGVLQFSVPTGQYFVALDINNEKGRQRGLKDFTVTTGSDPIGSLHLSSVLFAKDVVPASQIKSTTNTFFRNDVAVTPYPFSSLNRIEPLFIYFEIYDLFFDSSGKTRYEIDYQVKRKKKKDPSITVSEIRYGNSRNEPIFLQLDFRKLKPGKYDLTVRVKDKVAEIEKVRTMDLVLQ